MHKNSRISPFRRREIYELWKKGTKVSTLAREFRVTRRIIYVILRRARLKDFSIHKSTNHRFREIFYGLRNLSLREKQIRGKLAKQGRRYEKHYPGEMVHFDTKKLRRAKKDWKIRSEVLYVAIDDYSRQLFADIFPRRDAETSALFLEMVMHLAAYPIEEVYSDNGSEFKGNHKKHDFVWLCIYHGIQQKFTRVGRPQTNGKAERVIRTLLQEFLRKYEFDTSEERRKALQEYVRYYNEQRPHSAHKQGQTALTPCQILENYVNAKAYTTR